MVADVMPPTGDFEGERCARTRLCRVRLPLTLACVCASKEREEAEKLHKAGGMEQKIVKAKLTDAEQAKIKVAMPSLLST